MVILAALGGISTAIVDMTVEGEKEKRIIKASIWAGVAAAGVATGIDSSSAAVGGVMAAKELAGVVIEDKQTMGILDASAGVVTGAVSGNFVEVAKVTSTAAVGAGIGAAANGTDGIASGMQMGAQLGSGDLSTMGAKFAGAAAGGGVAALASGGKSTEILAGARLGASAAGTAAGLASTKGMLKDQQDLRPAEAETHKSSAGMLSEHEVDPKPITEAAVFQARGNAGVKLTGQIAGASVAIALDKDRERTLSAGSLERGLNAGGGLMSSMHGLGKMASTTEPTDKTAEAGTKPDAQNAKSATLPDYEVVPKPDLPKPFKVGGQIVGNLAGIGSAVAKPTIEHTLSRRVEETRARRKKGGSSKSELQAHELELELAQNITKLTRESVALRLA